MFGELLRSIPAPGLPGENRVIAYDGALHITAFLKGSTVYQYDPVTLLPLDSRSGAPGGTGPFCPFAERWLSLRPEGVVVFATTFAEMRTIVAGNPAVGDPLAAALDPSGALTTVSSGWRWRRYLYTGCTWALSEQTTVAPPGLGKPAGIAYDEHHLYVTANSDALGSYGLRRLDPVTFTVTGSSALPFAEVGGACAVVDRRLLVAIDGTVDRVFELSLN